MTGFLLSVSAEARIREDQAQVTLSAALRRLHRIATVDQMRLTAVLLEIYTGVGPEACWHLAGLLEVQRTQHDPELPLSETLDRLDTRLRHYSVLVEKWRNSERPSEGSGEGEA